MADLGEVIGALIAGLVDARRRADETTAQVAEHYKSNDLLAGMSVPRARVPELTIELPLLIEGVEEGESPSPAAPGAIRKAVADELSASLKRHGQRAPASMLTDFRAEVAGRLEKLHGPVGPVVATREGVANAVSAAAERVAFADDVPPEARRAVISEIKEKAREVALAKPGRPTKLTANVLTHEVKEHTGSSSVVRLKLVIREEGLEWSAGGSPDGLTETHTLTPE